MNGAKSFTNGEVLSLMCNHIYAGALAEDALKPTHYAGIGWRETPMEICDLMAKIGARLAFRQCILRSGRSVRADQAFEAGADTANNARLKQIFLPYRGYNGSTSELCPPAIEAFEIAKTYHPKWKSLSPQGQALQARNSHIMLGGKLNDPVAFAICYTEAGLSTGGTGQALRIADDRGIPIYNLQHSRLCAQFEAACNRPIAQAIGIMSLHGRHCLWL